MEENLSLDNTWNRMKELYPLAMEAFLKWIDEYKESVNWLELFNADKRQFILNDMQPIHVEIKSPKFHDLPLEMQVGIIAKWLFTVKQNNEGANFNPNWLFEKGYTSLGIRCMLTICFGQVDYILR